MKYDDFRALHERPGLFILPNPWDAGSARMLTALGFEALATTSAGYAFSVGLQDDPGALSREGVLANAKRIVEATHLPVSADLQDGFGPRPQTCAETIRMASQIGLAGGSIEDATNDPGAPIYEFDLAVERIQAAAMEARLRGFFLTARAENFLHGRPDLDDTIRRLRAYADAGADAVYAPGLATLEAIRQVCTAVRKPVNVLMGLKAAPFTLTDLNSVGVKRVSLGAALARAAYGGFMRAAREVKDRGTFSFLADAIPGAEISAYMAGAKRPPPPR